MHDKPSSFYKKLSVKAPGLQARKFGKAAQSNEETKTAPSNPINNEETKTAKILPKTSSDIINKRKSAIELKENGFDNVDIKIN